MSTDNGNDKNGSRSEVWNRLNQQSDTIHELARSQAATEANLASLANSVEVGFNQFNAGLQRLTERDSRPTNWLGVIGLFVVLMGAMITFVQLQTDPIKSRTRENTEQLSKVFERELKNAWIHGSIEAQLETLTDEIEKVDEHGSRRWIQAKPTD